MEIIINKLNLWQGKNVTVNRIADGSVQIVQYSVKESSKALVELKSPERWDSSNNYKLQVNLPSERTVEYILILLRSSANKYKVIYSTSLKTEIETFSNYAEINAYIKSLNLSCK